MHEIHLNIELTPDTKSNCDFYYDYNQIQYNLESFLILKNLQDNSIFKSNLDTSLSNILAGFIFHSKNLYIDQYVGSIESHFYPINCSCGHPECVGILNGVIVSHNQKFVTWKSHKRSGYHSDFLPPVITFHKEQYISFILNMRKKLIQLELEQPNLYRINGQSIPVFFKEIARLQAISLKYKIKSDFFKIFHLVDQNLNSFHNRNITSLDEESMERILKENFYYSLTNKLFTHVELDFSF